MEGNFAAQMKQAISPENRAAMPAAVQSTSQAAPAQAPTNAPNGNDPLGLMSPMGDMELPSGGKPEVKPPEVPAKIKIKGHEFNSIEEAYDFVATQQARLDGKEEVLNKLQVQPPKEEPKPAEPKPTPWENDIANELFTNPESALLKMYNKAKEDAKKEVFDRYGEIQAEQKRTQALETQLKQTWDGFYDQNKDLSADRDIVDYIVEKNWAQVKDMPWKESGPIIAEKTRQFLRRNRENSLPQTTLPDGPALMAQGNGSTFRPQAQAQSTPEKVVDMVSQLRNAMAKHRPN